MLAGAARLGLRQGPLQRGRWAGPPRPSAPHGPPPRQGRRRSRLLQVRLRAARGLRRPPRLQPGGPALHAHCPQPTLTSAGRGGAEAGPADACALPPLPGSLTSGRARGRGEDPASAGRPPAPNPRLPGLGSGTCGALSPGVPRA